MWWKKATKMPPDVEERLLTLERQMRELKLDWESTHDKLVALVARYNKRAERLHGPEAEPENASPTGTTIASAPSPRLDPVSQRILDRRRRFFPSRPPGGNSAEEAE